MPVKNISNDKLEEVKELLARLESGASVPHLTESEKAEQKGTLQRIIDSDLWRLSEFEPVRNRGSDGSPIVYEWGHFPRDGGWLYQNCVYEVTGTYAEEERKLLIMEYCDKERQKFERLKAKFNSEASQEITRERDKVPEDVRIAVWRRDQGKCARCGGRENLEYDHIVPVSKGGSNTVRNVELLCESCNRQKGDRIQ